MKGKDLDSVVGLSYIPTAFFKKILVTCNRKS
jgi:hypothetical protein